MKVRIKKYPTWFGPYQLMERIFFWTKTEDEYGLPDRPDWVHNAGEWYADTWLGRGHIWLAQKHQSWQDRRRVSVKIDPWDTWNADDTLAHIVLPTLVDLKQSKQGAPNVDPKMYQRIFDQVNWNRNSIRWMAQLMRCSSSVGIMY